MESLVHTMLMNAVAAAILAVAVAALSRFCRRPALLHCLWLLVLIKLVTPPFVPLSLRSSLWTYPNTLGSGRAISTSQSNDSGAIASWQRGNEQPDDFWLEPQHHRPSLADQIATGVQDPSTVVHEQFRQGGDSSEPAGRQTPAGKNATLHAAVPYAPPGWAIRLVATLACVRWEALVFFVVLCGAALWWSLAIVRIVRFHRVLKDGRPVPAQWQDQSDELARQLGLARSPQVLLVPGQVPPMLWAIGGRPRLLIPSQLWPSLEPEEQSSLLLHELAHLRRRDHWVRWLELSVGGLYWWHPALWWARRGLREAEEQCCDAWVVSAMPRAAKTYAAALVAALEFVSGARTAPAAASATSGNGHVSCLKRRLRMIVRASTPKGLSWIGRLAVLGTAALILPLAPSWAQDNLTKAGETGSGQVDSRDQKKPHAGANDLPEFRAAISLHARLLQDDKSDKKDDKSRDAAKRLEHQGRELIEKLGKDFGPVGEEFLKALERAIGEVHKSLEKENPSSDDLRKALEKSQDDMRRALERGGPVDHELREALERSRRELREAWDHAQEDLRQVMRERVEVARQREREREHERERQRQQAERAREQAERAREHAQPGAGRGRPEDAETSQHRQEVENARREIRELEQQLRRATRRLEELDRRETRREQRRPATRPRAEAEPPRTPAAPGGRPAPPTEEHPPALPARPGQRNARRPGVIPGAPGSARTPAPAPRSDYERRFRSLEDKLDQLLKELENMKREQRITPTTSARAGSGVVSNSTAAITTAV